MMMLRRTVLSAWLLGMRAQGGAPAARPLALTLPLGFAPFAPFACRLSDNHKWGQPSGRARTFAAEPLPERVPSSRTAKYNKSLVRRLKKTPCYDASGPKGKLSEQSELKTNASSQTRQNWENFVRGLPATLTGDVVYRAGLFKAADENKDGHISPEELSNFLREMPNTELTENQIGQLIQAADINRDGKLQIDEFINLFKVANEKGVSLSKTTGEEEE